MPVVAKILSRALAVVSHAAIVGTCILGNPAMAQKLVDPNSVAPEYREAAEKRRAEQIRQLECARSAAEAKVLPRDRTAYITQCLAEERPTQASAAARQ